MRAAWPAWALTAVTAVLAVAMHGASVLWVLIIVCAAVTTKTVSKSQATEKRLNQIVGSQGQVNSTLGADIASVNSRVNSLSGQFTDGENVQGQSSTSTNGLPNGQITGTSGAQSTGTAHTHGGGSYAVTSGQHSHTYNDAHDHQLPSV